MSIEIEVTTKGKYFVIISNKEGGVVAWGEDITWKKVMKLIKKYKGKLL